jgi:hypothetical protein
VRDVRPPTRPRPWSRPAPCTTAAPDELQRFGRIGRHSRFASDDREHAIGAPACPGSFGSELESGAGRHHWHAARAHGRDDLHRHALAGQLERVSVAQLVRREPTPDACPGGDPELVADSGPLPRPPSRSAVDHAEQRSNRRLCPRGEPWPQLVRTHSSMPSSRRRRPLLRRTGSEPRCWSRSLCARERLL